MWLCYLRHCWINAANAAVMIMKNATIIIAFSWSVGRLRFEQIDVKRDRFRLNELTVRVRKLKSTKLLLILFFGSIFGRRQPVARLDKNHKTKNTYLADDVGESIASQSTPWWLISAAFVEFGSAFGGTWYFKVGEFVPNRSPFSDNRTGQTRNV